MDFTYREIVNDCVMVAVNGFMTGQWENSITQTLHIETNPKTSICVDGHSKTLKQTNERTNEQEVSGESKIQIGKKIQMGFA